jgi:hypothetical protein
MGTVSDISTKGIGLILNAGLSRGSFLDISLEHADGQRLSSPLRVRVRRVVSQPNGNWLVGCNFVNKISENELQAFLRDD